MAKLREHLEKAPIVEALIDFRVLPRSEVTPETFAALGTSMGRRYPQKSIMQSVEARFGLEDGRPFNSLPMQREIGWTYRNDTEIAQFRLDGFTFNKVEPYTTWGEVFGEAHRLWGIYVNAAQPAQVSRVAVRYINRMRVPAATELRDYLAAPPLLPAPIPQVVREFLTRVYVDDQMRNASAVIVQALEQSVEATTMTLLLDIDAFREVNRTPHDPELPEIFQQLRELKNDIFFASITEKTVEMYA